MSGRTGDSGELPPQSSTSEPLLEHKTYPPRPPSLSLPASWSSFSLPLSPVFARYHKRHHSPGRCSRFAVLVALSGAVVLLMFYLILSLAGTSYGSVLSPSPPSSDGPVLALDDPLAQQYYESLRHFRPGEIFREAAPFKAVHLFLSLAEREVDERGLDTDDDKLGRKLVEGYVRSRQVYAHGTTTAATDLETDVENHGHTTRSVTRKQEWDESDIDTTFTLFDHSDLGQDQTHDSGSAVLCMPVMSDPFINWWPVPSSPCISVNLRTTPTHTENPPFLAVNSTKTEQGVQLDEDMGDETFLGSRLEFIRSDNPAAQCSSRIRHTVVVIHRQDQWNPFHVAEDLITTVSTLLITATAIPALMDHHVQLVFTDNFNLEGNHYVTLWDRVGSWEPRRLALDPWREGECLTNAVHSVGAGMSLLSAMGVGDSYQHASTITWAASHFYRHLLGLQPRSFAEASPGATHKRRRPINILLVSRSKLDKILHDEDRESPWQQYRVLVNEPELIAEIKKRLSDVCSSKLGSKIFGRAGCRFEDADDVPETWSDSGPLSPQENGNDQPVPLRFAVIDPTVYALESQVAFAGHTSVLVGQHGGGLGLSLFMPPGDGAIVELQVPQMETNFHFEHMAFQLGHQYWRSFINRRVDIETVWPEIIGSVEGLVKMWESDL